MRDWITDRFEDIRRKGVRDRGFVLVSTIMLFVMVSGTVYWLISATDRTVKSSFQTSDFIQSGQLADLAIQDAMYQLNEVRPATLPAKATPRKGGTDNDGAWEWYADPVTLGDGGKTAVLHATGTFRGAIRKVQATAQGPRVGGFKVEADDSITYQVAPSTAFSHTVLGSSVTVQNGITGASPFLSGSVGLLGNTLDVKAAAGTTSKADVNYYQYGPNATSLTVAGGVRAPAGLSLDPQFITDNMASCGGATPQDWKASQNGGVLTASTPGNVGCYASMDFDVPTVIQGSGSFNAYVSGGVTVRENISAATGTGLNIYANGNVGFPTEEADGSSLTVRNLYVYAPQGLCSTPTAAAGGFRSLTKSLDFSGSLACKTVRVAGTFKQGDNTDSRYPDRKGPISPTGDDIFDNTVWYLADYQQPTGSRVP
ncbi:hypothetical protein Achl_4172 (plasmid) [Pseudarthrobacter chlorophenolicus A6]|uniref:Uncharacterized protein n=1 Tax=Pseudarthrobacter chlorophenolicus (strain ATCC 700700 / DSM 12829 / CIP 107037 / JCM 12360 / KCTC 9906 / NCIMB 13794 / A6) TaxID=452863 RepID=B8HI76_PSECP|nr:hypothetical protein [Pseudarthrobacter chlorophenolicus]ACL42123.1 hypothetical protein Achl_4172 [Pseudarthrobacter chlorophenolicus A6]SDQ13735.1 hypothetical protein SAMN04489738_0231 [Pseudarthrobacter chlorophenolicus]